MLNPQTQRQMDEVLAGRSTELWLTGDLTAVPEEIRELTGLRSLYLAETHIEMLPPWLDELPNLKEIDIGENPFRVLPSFLPMVRWGVDADQILTLGNQLDLSKIFALSINPKTSGPAIQHAFELGRSNLLELSAFSVAAPRIGLNDGPQEMQRPWSFFEVIDAQLDEFLETCQEIHRLDLFGYPIAESQNRFADCAFLPK